MLELTARYPLKRKVTQVHSLKELCVYTIIGTFHRTDVDFKEMNAAIQSLPQNLLDLITKVNETEKQFHRTIQNYLIEMDAESWKQIKVRKIVL
jgi:hypothetical protein